MVIEIRPGEGGDHAVRFAKKIKAALTASLRRHDYEFDVDESPRIITIRTNATPLVKFSGTHRLQGQSGQARHTSTATVAFLEESEDVKI